MTDSDIDQFIGSESAMSAIPEEGANAAEAVDDNDQQNQSASLNDSQCLTIALNIYHKIDTERRGFIDRDMLKAYCQRILGYVQPDGNVDEDSLDAGFKALDRNQDGRITLEDLVRFAQGHRKNESEEIPDGFIRYSES